MTVRPKGVPSGAPTGRKDVAGGVSPRYMTTRTSQPWKGDRRYQRLCAHRNSESPTAPSGLVMERGSAPGVATPGYYLVTPTGFYVDARWTTFVMCGS